MDQPETMDDYRCSTPKLALVRGSTLLSIMPLPFELMRSLHAHYLVFSFCHDHSIIPIRKHYVKSSLCTFYLKSELPVLPSLMCTHALVECASQQSRNRGKRS